MSATRPPTPITDSDIFVDYFELLSKNDEQKSSEISVKSVSLSVPSVLFTFQQWLKSKHLSAVSIRNYISDISQFLVIIKGDSLPSPYSNSAPAPDNFTITPSHFLSYRNKLSQSDLPRATINRKLSSLRQLGTFLEDIYHLTDPTTKLENVPQPQIDNWLKNFQYHLRTKHHKSKTITNYVSDVRHYLNWATNNTD